MFYVLAHAFGRVQSELKLNILLLFQVHIRVIGIISDMRGQTNQLDSERRKKNRIAECKII